MDIVPSLKKGHGSFIKGSRLIVKGTKKGTLYCLHDKSLMGKFIALAEIHSHMELWHKRLGHMSQKGLDKEHLICKGKRSLYGLKQPP